MCDPADEHGCARWLSPEGAVSLGLCGEVGVWRLRTPVTDLIGRMEDAGLIGLDDAVQQAIGDAERGALDDVAEELRTLITEVADDPLP